MEHAWTRRTTPGWRSSTRSAGATACRPCRRACSRVPHGPLEKARTKRSRSRGSSKCLIDEDAVLRLHGRVRTATRSLFLRHVQPAVHQECYARRALYPRGASGSAPLPAVPRPAGRLRALPQQGRFKKTDDDRWGHGCAPVDPRGGLRQHCLHRAHRRRAEHPRGLEADLLPLQAEGAWAPASSATANCYTASTDAPSGPAST